MIRYNKLYKGYVMKKKQNKLAPSLEGINGEVLTARQTADYLKVSYQVLADWRHKGVRDLKWTRCGRHIRYLKKDIQEFLEKSSTKKKGD
jgi:hypothetical protein